MSPKNCKYVYFDMDGTMLNKARLLDKETLAAVERAKKAGYGIGIVSGRPHQLLSFAIRQLKPNLPPIAMNGGLIAGNSSHWENPLSSVMVSEKDRKTLIDYFFDNGLPFLHFESDEISYYAPVWHDYFDTVAEFMVNNHAPEDRWKLRRVKDRSELNGIRAFKLFSLISHLPKEKVDEIKSFVDKNAPGVTAIRSAVYGLDIVPSQCSKGQGLKAIAKLGVIKLEDTIAVGDEENDVPMFKVAAWSVAMKNSPDHIKQMCNEVTDYDNDHLGVARYLDKLVANNGH